CKAHSRVSNRYEQQTMVNGRLVNLVFIRGYEETPDKNQSQNTVFRKTMALI
ncbi:hypothetical protein KIL84_013650, partial [Mauremys mutica]